MFGLNPTVDSNTDILELAERDYTYQEVLWLFFSFFFFFSFLRKKITLPVRDGGLFARLGHVSVQLAAKGVPAFCDFCSCWTACLTS